MIKYFICDVDGVILDRMPVYQEAFVRRVAELGVDEGVAAEFYYATAGDPLEKQFRDVLDQYKIDYSEEKIREMRQSFFKEVGEVKPRIFRGAKETIDKLKDKGLKILYTSGSNTE
ncbi:MAG: HAD hydrolase-like protein, partial [Candidatus Moranbacteria bacterium]|nr:HAD hydrolase-like protein [Candidatus Moranbacteria bacterium]